MSRERDLERFYALMDALRARGSGLHTLAGCDGRMEWPGRGVYFFYEPGEGRAGGAGPRIVRVGTHALAAGSSTTLWHRLSQHAGSRRSGGGNHRGSIFRLLVGEAMKVRDGDAEPASWGVGGSPGQAANRLGLDKEAMKQKERALEQRVSTYVRVLPFLFVAVEDKPGSASERGVIERGSIALLSNFRHTAVDPASPQWLGHHSARERVRMSGLWNNNHVDEDHDPAFLAVLARAVEGTRPVVSR